ncbi:hypothetical protein BJP27_24320 (plasmid) [Pseudomonas oryzihabitans]|nr:hypothetical protein BJP27_24320 [Pseudomonas psychrotolerans]
MKYLGMLVGVVTLCWAVRHLWRDWETSRNVVRERAASRREEVATGKRCPSCLGNCFVRLPSMNLKLCADCHGEIPWHLSEGQVQTLAPSRAHRKVIPQ